MWSAISRLLTRCQRFLLIGSDQAFPFLLGLLVGLPHLLPLLLRGKGGIGADGHNLRMSIASDGTHLVRDRLLDAGLLPARSLSPAILGGWWGCRWIALRQNRPCEEKKNSWTEKFSEHGEGLQ